MKEDYLWDKTGNDPEIEKLETALLALRYRETAPPALPAKVVSFPVKAPHRVFRFALAAAACVAFGVISLGVWFQILKNNMDVNVNVAETNQPQSIAPAPDNNTAPETTAVRKPDEPIITKIENSKRSSERKFVKTRHVVPVNTRQKTAKLQNSNQINPVVTLTQEEKFAYNQLMLALSITGSKLKTVKDKIEGFDEKNVVR